MKGMYGDVPYIHPEMDKQLASDNILKSLRKEMSGEIESPKKFDNIKNKMKVRIGEILENLIRN